MIDVKILGILSISIIMTPKFKFEQLVAIIIIKVYKQPFMETDFHERPIQFFVCFCLYPLPES